MQLGSMKNVVARNNIVEKVGSVGIWSMASENVLIENNTLLEIHGAHSDGMAIYQGSINVSVIGNKIFSSNLGFSLQASKDLNVINNVIDLNGQESIGIVLWGTSGAQSGYLNILNNIVMGCNKNTALSLDINNNPELTTVVVKNNILDGWSSQSVQGGKLSVSNNIYTGLSWSQKTGPPNNWYLMPGEFQADIYDLFINPDSYDYRLKGTSPAINNGTDLSSFGFRYDIDGISRPQGSAWDIGAYEYDFGNVPTLPFNKADLDEDYRINITEVGLFIDVWKAKGVALSEVIDAIRIWSHGECYNEEVCGASATAFVNNFEEDEIVEEIPVEDEIIEEVVVPEVSGNEVLWLKFDGNLGGYSANGNVSFVDGHSGQAASFDGDGDWLDLGTDLFGIENSGKFTISAWVKPDSLLGHQLIVGRGVYLYPFRLELEEKLLKAGVRTSDGTFYIASKSGFNVNSWNFVVMTYDGSVLKVYLNGVEENLKVVPGNLTIANNHASGIGGLSGSDVYFDGAIDDVRIWVRALSEEEIRALG